MKRIQSKTEADIEIINGGFWDTVRRVAGQVPFVEDAVAAYYAVMDPNTSAAAKATLAAALAYFVLPVDAVPDFFMGVGFVDDAAVLTAALAAVRESVTDRHRRRARKTLTA
jgi:uncharacterized membrane protein YkvA (DUF1232 family)